MIERIAPAGLVGFRAGESQINLTMAQWRDEEPSVAMPALDVFVRTAFAQFSLRTRNDRAQRSFEGQFMKEFEAERLADHGPDAVCADCQIVRLAASRRELKFAV